MVSRIRLLRRLFLSDAAQLYTRIRHPGVFDNVSRFCMFIGHGRSGSSLVGALLNAHPNIVMSNELNVFDYLTDDMPRSRLFNLIYYSSGHQARKGSRGGGGYTYGVPDQWQGKHKTIKIVGDRKAGATAILLFRQPALLAQLRQVVDMPVSFISVVRNPFDTLVTSLKKTIRQQNESEQEHLQRLIGHYFERVTAIKNVQSALGSESVKFVYHDRLIMNPHRTLKDLCEFLNVEANDMYLDSCASIIHPKANVTRDHVRWPRELVEMVNSGIAETAWLQRYAHSDK